ncbi:MAG: DUF1700 domain-containing protein [Lachnospiraceae bacterium]|nr:DUF1700 domain-containing protein [Lachnospiraceae bacterium]
MKKEEFVQELRQKLSGIPQSDIEERVSYYCEMIDDRMEDGLSEEEAVAAIGSVDDVVAQIMSEIPLSKLVKHRATKERKWNAGMIVLLVLGFPLWFSLLIAFFAVLLSLYITLWSIVISFYAVVLALALTALVSLPAALIFLSTGKPAGSVLCIGAGMFCAGLAILFFLLSTAMTKGIIFLTAKLLLGIKHLVVGKEAA